MRAAVFLHWGYCLGYWFNIGFGYWRVEFVQLKTFVFLYATMCVAICWFLLAISGVTPTTISAMLQAEHWRAWHAAWWCCFGLLIGLLRPLEYFLLQFRPSPGVNERARGRAWAPPGLTLLPAYRMRDALGNWLDVDRDEGVHIASQLSVASRQQQPLITPLHDQLAVCQTDEMLGLGFEICDSGAVCATDVFKPPLVRNFKAPAIRGKGRDRRIYEHEVALAKAINAPKTPPEFNLEGDANTINAMLWYYNQGYLYKAAEVWRHAGGKGGAIAVSSPRIAELGALIAATRWVWRARHCGGAARNSCRDRFVADVERIAQQAQSKPLAERNLIRSITKHWQTQIKKLLRDGKVQPGFDPVHIRPWKAMHGELGELDPWSKFCAELHWRWQSGYTVVTLVDGLPKSQTGQAVAAAVDSLPATVQAMCDLVHLPDDPFVPKLLFNLCQEVAAKLQRPDPMPVGLASLSPPMIRDEIIRLCAQMPTTHVVVYIKNARRLVNGDVPTNIALLALQELGELERRVHNLALTLEAGSGKEVMGLLRSRVTSAGLRADMVNLPLLEWSGVQQWLDLQFGAACLYCDDQRRLLLEVLAEINCRQQRPANAAEIAARSTANIKLPEIYVQETLDHWSQVKLVEEIPGRLTYRLRSLSFAKWMKP